MIVPSYDRKAYIYARFFEERCIPLIYLKTMKAWDIFFILETDAFVKKKEKIKAHLGILVWRLSDIRVILCTS